MPKLRKGPVEPYSVAAHGGDPQKTRATRAVKRHTSHAIRGAEKLRGKAKRKARADSRTVMAEEKGSTLLAHLPHRSLRALILKGVPTTTPDGAPASTNTVRIDTAELERLKASGLLSFTKAAA